MNIECTSNREKKFIIPLATYWLPAPKQYDKECKHMLLLLENRKGIKQFAGFFFFFFHPLPTRRVKADLVMADHSMLSDSVGMEIMPTGQPLQEGWGSEHLLPAEAGLLTCRPGLALAPVCPQRRGQSHPLCCFQP